MILKPTASLLSRLAALKRAVGVSLILMTPARRLASYALPCIALAGFIEFSLRSCLCGGKRFATSALRPDGAILTALANFADNNLQESEIAKICSCNALGCSERETLYVETHK